MDGSRNCYRKRRRLLIKSVFEYTIHNPGFASGISGLESTDRTVHQAFGDDDRNAVVDCFTRDRNINGSVFYNDLRLDESAVKVFRTAPFGRCNFVIEFCFPAFSFFPTLSDAGSEEE
jgi:hypothetical protein